MKLNITKLSLWKDNRSELRKQKGAELLNSQIAKNLKSQLDDVSQQKFNHNRVRYVYNAETSKSYQEMSQRIAYKRRLHMTNKPVIIIYFEGVIGFKNKEFLYLRDGARKFIQRLWSDFQVVLVTNYNPKNTLNLREILEKRGLDFDAIYSLNFEDPKWNYAYYDQIYKDFLIK